MVEAYNGWTAGFMPHTGGMSDQASNYLTIMQWFGSALNRVQFLKNQKAAPTTESSGGGVSVLRR